MKMRLAAAAAALVSSAAIADTVDVKFLGTGAGTSVKINLGGNANNVFAGQLYHQFSNGTGKGAELNGTYITFCTDLTEYVTSTTKSYNVVSIAAMPNSSPMGAAKAQAIADLYAYGAGQQLITTAANDYAAAFQIAIWEIVSDFNPFAANNGLNLTAGSLKVTKTNGSALSSSITNTVAAMFAALGTNSSHGGILGVSRNGSQDQLVVVPLPTPGLLALAGFAGVVALRRRLAR